MTEWERCKPWIEAALRYAGGTHTIEDVEAAVVERRAMLLAGKQSAIVVEVKIFPRQRALHIWLAGGDLDELKSVFTSGQIDVIARAHGCRHVTISGRRGWLRALKDEGFSEVCTMVARNVK